MEKKAKKTKVKKVKSKKDKKSNRLERAFQQAVVDTVSQVMAIFGKTTPVANSAQDNDVNQEVEENET